MEMSDYINEPRRDQKCNSNTTKTERTLYRLLLLSFGVLCIIQAILNISLRLTSYFSLDTSPSDCNITLFRDKKQTMEHNCERGRPDHCNRLQEEYNALTREKNDLQNRISELNNMIRNLKRLKRREADKINCVASKRCPPDWQEIQTKCYFHSTEPKTWRESRTYCQNKGGDLVVIDSGQEQAALSQLDVDFPLPFWIGLYKTSRIFKWVDGSALTKSFWKPGQLDLSPFLDPDTCTLMYPSKLSVTNWEEAPCKQKQHWLCEMAQKDIFMRLN